MGVAATGVARAHGRLAARHAPWSCLTLLVALGGGCRDVPPHRGGPAPDAVRVGVAEPTTGTRSDSVVAVMDRLRYAALVTTARDGAVQAGLAERWESSPDGLEWRFTLRPRLAFADGVPLDAAAVARVLDDARRAPRAAPGLRDIVSVRADGPRTVVVTQRAPSTLLFEAISQEWITRPGSPAMAGPYRLVSGGGPGETAVLEAFDAYYLGPPGVRRVEIRGYPSPRAAWVALMRDEIDVLYDVPPEAIEFVEASTDVQAYSFLRSYVHLLGFNLAHPVLRDRRVRVALDMAVDRHAVIRHTYAGRGVPANDGLWPRHWAYDAAAAPRQHDPVRARALLAEALPGLPRGDRAGRPAPRLRLSCILPAGYPEFERSALVLQKQLLDVGVDLALEVLPAGELIARLGAGRFETYVFEQLAGPGLNWTYSFWHSPEGEAPWVRSGYRSVDAALEALRRAPTPDALRAALREVQRGLAADPPAVFLAWTETSRAVRRRFIVSPDSDRDVFPLLPLWRRAEGVSR
jgi:peptide/nickel transport system substrate-binding protein